MEKKLTAQIIGAYMPKKLWYSNTDFAFSAMSIANESVTIGGMQVHWEYCQLILTPISEISEEDLIEVIKRCEWWDCYKRYTEMRIEGMRLKFNGWKVIGGYDTAQKCEQSCLNQSQIDYLRSPVRPDGTPKPVYDCGYGSISSLIEAGIAVKGGEI